MNTSRLETVRQLLIRNGVNAILVSSPKHIKYLSGFTGLTETEREAFLLITKKTQYILTSKLYGDEAKVSSPNFTFIEVTAQSPIFTKAWQLLTKSHLKTLGIEDANLTVAEFQKLQEKIKGLFPISLHTIRVQKDATEIKKIEKACNIGDRAFSYICKEIKPGVSEKHIVYLLESFFREEGASPSFPSIVAFGKHAAVPHHVSGNKVLQKNSFVLLDFGVKIDNYCSDMTRTIFVGVPSSEEKKMYETVRMAQERAIEYINNVILVSRSEAKTHPGSLTDRDSGYPSEYLLHGSGAARMTIRASEVDKVARDYIISQNYPSFPHGLGHGIGLEVHEAPSLSPHSTDVLEEGMVFSIEPGIYVSGKVGIRIEDLVAITDKGLVELTHSSKKLILL